MIVYVVTHKQLEKSFLDWKQEKTNQEQTERQFIYQVFVSFMNSPDAKLFHTVTGLICFPIAQWKIQFEQWCVNEITLKPKSEETIRHWSERLINHLESPWCIDEKLIVSECLDQHDLQQFEQLKVAV
jgi:hypothetical protein